MSYFLKSTAIKMVPPKPYGLFHISFFIFGLIISFYLANKLKNINNKQNKRLLFLTGIFLLIIEIYKELFYFYVVNNGHYDWSTFPFQLCDIPMYICLAIIFIKNKKVEEGMYNFMASYNLLGAFITFLEPSALCRPYLFMTIHGFLWHLILIFLGIYIAMSGRCLKQKKDFITSTKVYAILCSIALLLNISLKNISNGKLNAFYLGPVTSPIVVFQDISIKFGWFTNLLVFVLSMTLGAYLIYIFFYNLDNIKMFIKSKYVKEQLNENK